MSETQFVEKRWSWDQGEPETGYKYIAEVEWDDESYQFNLTRIYLKEATGELFYATDSGCSCPSPFEDTTVSDLKPISRLQDWYDHVAGRLVVEDPTADYQYPPPTPASAISQAETARKTIETHLKGL